MGMAAISQFRLKVTDEADENLRVPEKDKSLENRLKAVCRALGYLKTNPKHPSLSTHKYSSLNGENGEKIFEAYAKNNTPTRSSTLVKFLVFVVKLLFKKTSEMTSFRARPSRKIFLVQLLLSSMDR